MIPTAFLVLYVPPRNKELKPTSCMRQVSERVVLGQKAYILFYIRSPTNGRSAPASAPPPMRPAPSSPRNQRVPNSETAPRPCNSAPQPRPSASRPTENGVAERPAVKRKLTDAFAGSEQQQTLPKKAEGGLPNTPLQVPGPHSHSLLAACALLDGACELQKCKRALKRLVIIFQARTGGIHGLFGAQGKRKSMMLKMDKSAMGAPEEKQDDVAGDADMRARQASHAAASVSPFATSKVCNYRPWWSISFQRLRICIALCCH